MRLVLENVNEKHKILLLEMARALKFKVSGIELTQEEEDKAMLTAMEEGKKGGRATKKEQENFEQWLKAI